MANVPDTGLETMTGSAEPMVPSLFRIQRVRQETYDTFTLELEPPGEKRTFTFVPGQFNMLYVLGVGEAPISISGDPADSHVLVHTTRAVGTVTKAMRTLKRGDVLGVRGPFGSTWPVAEAAGNDVIIVAGGIGLAPLRPVIYRILAERERYGKVIFLYGTRTPADILYRRELEQWRSRFDLDVQITVDRAQAGWRANVGVVTTLIPKVAFDPANTIAMVCGPEVMMRFTIQALQKRGLGLKDIYVSMERNMKCGIGICGHCQYGPMFICKDGPVFSYDRIKDLFLIREL
ncbi:MAG: FAD/NAD(P)-binding protein [Bacteroidota bacterium]|jgi:NAD(P)H-flavin reductase